MDAFIDGRLWYNGKWTAELLCRGAAVHKIARIENLRAVKGTLLVVNPTLLDSEEQALINGYTGGDVLTIGLDKEGRISFSGTGKSLEAVMLPTDVVDPHGAIWTDSLTFMDIDPTFVDEAAEFINRKCGLPVITDDCGACHINEVMTSENTSRLFLDNQEFYYATPWVRTEQKIRNIRFVTKPECYPVQQRDDYSFRIRVPGFGMDIIEIEYENS